jgi:hypothetical protein
MLLPTIYIPSRITKRLPRLTFGSADRVLLKSAHLERPLLKDDLCHQAASLRIVPTARVS